MGVITPMFGHNYAEFLEVDPSLSLFLSLSLHLFASSDVSFNKRVKRGSIATLRKAVNHSKPKATNTSLWFAMQEISACGNWMESCIQPVDRRCDS